MAENPKADDPSIPDDSYVLRRIPPSEVTADCDSGWKPRPKSSNFADNREKGPVSIVLSCLLRKAERNDQDVLSGHPGFFLVRIPVRIIRALGLDVVASPTSAEPAHGLIVGTKTTSIRKKLARAAEWIVSPPEEKG